MVAGRRSVAPVVGIALLVAACGSPGLSPGPTTSSPPPTGPGATAGASSTAVPTIAGATPILPSVAPTGAVAVPASGAWARIEVDGPAPGAREDHTWTLDESGRVAYLFGGRRGGTTFRDLWAFDLAAGTWRRLAPPGAAPAARFGHEAAWIPGRGLAVSLGQAGSTFFDDLWLFDPAAGRWRELPAAGAAPVARYGSCSGFELGRLWISHGFTEDGVRFADTRAYDFATEAWADVTPSTGDLPVKRCLHACWWTSTGEFVLYGGQTNGAAALGDLWRLDPRAGSWSQVPDPAPAARQLAAVGRAGDLTIVFGGRDPSRSPLRDTWLLADDSTAFTRLATPGETPSARSGAAFVHDAAGDRMLLFGGIGDAALDDLWELTFD